MDLEPIYCAEQIRVPAQLDDILKAYTKEVIRRKPDDLIEFSAFYFANLANIVPETSVVVQPTIQQIESLYRDLSNATESTCDTRMIILRAQEAGINENTVTEVLKVGQFSTTGPVDAAQFCVLLVTTITLDTPGLLGALVQVFGDGSSIDAKLCQHVLTALGNYDDRWQHGDVLQQVEAAAVDGKLTEATLLEIPAVKGMAEAVP